MSARRRFHVPGLLLLLLMAGCRPSEQAAPPTLIPLAQFPPTPTAINLDSIASWPDEIDAEAKRPEQRPPAPATAASTLEANVEIGPNGIRPGQARVFRPADETYIFAGDVTTDGEWRPPPYPAPLSFHPDDHYWLIRPIPSGYRNYDLEWYPYGSDVLLPELPPYRIHHGLDFPNSTGTPILAAAAGEIIWAGPLPSDRDGVNYYGNTVIILHDWQWLGQNVYTLYAHTLELFVAVGDKVETGQLIAGVGTSGEVSGAHLHLEVRVGKNNYYQTRNPALWIAPYEGWGTLAGRFVDNRGRFITNAEITVKPQNVAGPTRTQRTYAYDGVTPDEIWGENFVVGDLPAGRYLVHLSVNGIIYQRTVDILPGRTNYISVQAEFEFFPTPTPLPEPTSTITTTE